MFLIIGCIIGAIIWYYFGQILPVVYTLISDKFKVIWSGAIDESTSECLGDMTLDDYIIIRTDEDGYITYYGINSVGVNALARSISDSVRIKLQQYENSGVEMQLGIFTGIPLLTGLGPTVTLDVVSLAVVDAQFTSEFIESGYNQTLHSMYINIVIEGDVILPGYSNSIENSTTILVNEMVVVGSTPDTVVDL